MDRLNSSPQSQLLNPDTVQDNTQGEPQYIHIIDGGQYLNSPPALGEPNEPTQQEIEIDKLVDNGGLNYTEARLRVLGTSPQAISAPALSNTVANPTKLQNPDRRGWKNDRRTRKGLSPKELLQADEPPKHIRAQEGRK